MRKKRMERELNHPHFVGVRLSDIELELLDRKAEILGISRSECLRELLVEKEIVHRVEVVADMEELRSLVGAYGKIGVNLNQIARYFNTGGERSLAMEDEIRHCIAELFALREEVLKMAGDYRNTTKLHFSLPDRRNPRQIYLRSKKPGVKVKKCKK